ADEASHVIAPEVKSLQFRYFDGSNWQDSWDGTQPGPDGVTPQGPPRAIELTIGFGTPDNPDAALKTVRHVIAIPPANRSATPAPGPRAQCPHAPQPPHPRSTRRRGPPRRGPFGRAGGRRAPGPGRLPVRRADDRRVQGRRQLRPLGAGQGPGRLRRL